ncbi:MAG: hypothetical protein MJ252_05100 [archaeon]|nr:hypothetical protein [archaeon]
MLKISQSGMEISVKDKMINKLETNTNKLTDTNNVANEIIGRDKMTAMEIRRQGNQLENISNTLDNTEAELSIVDQITEVMKYNHLYYKLKLYAVIVLLFLANLIVLYLKF